jgi:hypothetical protein
MKQDRYLIFQVKDGRLETFGLCDTYAAAEKRVASAGLSAEWKIATIAYWPEPVPEKRHAARR